MNHIVVVDLGFGDAGKGGVVDWLCARPGTRPYRTVIRFNGGAQAAHNVITPGGRHHTFAQFGSGTFVPGVRTHLSRHMIVDPLALAAEAAHLRALGIDDAFGRLTVDRDALLATPYHQAANRARSVTTWPVNSVRWTRLIPPPSAMRTVLSRGWSDAPIVVMR